MIKLPENPVAYCWFFGVFLRFANYCHHNHLNSFFVSIAIIHTEYIYCCCWGQIFTLLTAVFVLLMIPSYVGWFHPHVSWTPICAKAVFCSLPHLTPTLKHRPRTHPAWLLICMQGSGHSRCQGKLLDSGRTLNLVMIAKPLVNKHLHSSSEEPKWGVFKWFHFN